MLLVWAVPALSVPRRGERGWRADLEHCGCAQGAPPCSPAAAARSDCPVSTSAGGAERLRKHPPLNRGVSLTEQQSGKLLFGCAEESPLTHSTTAKPHLRAAGATGCHGGAGHTAPITAIANRPAARRRHRPPRPPHSARAPRLAPRRAAQAPSCSRTPFQARRALMTPPHLASPTASAPPPAAVRMRAR